MRSRFYLLFLAVAVIVPAMITAPAAVAQPARAGAAAGPKEYRSRNFIVYTDLTPAEAKDLLARLEKMLGLISRYWGAPNRRVIECYVVKDINAWPPGVLHPDGEAKVRAGAGVTISRISSRGGRVVSAKAIVFAIADRGTPQHEAVHAYCSQTFGRTGPVWYSEGMAEMGQYWKKDDLGVTASPYVIEYLTSEQPKSLNAIVNGEEFTGDSWQNYAWRWALCHLLANNTNYRERFRPLGLALLNDKPNVSFESVYGAMAKEIVFEYLFFLEHLTEGYRVDLCSWDWKSRFKALRGTATAKIEAKAGWQASKISVDSGEVLSVRTEGEVTTETASGSDPAATKEPQLVGVIFSDYELSEPFPIPSSGTVTMPSEGKLFLRIEDDWGSLGDNTGSLTVKLADQP